MGFSLIGICVCVAIFLPNLLYVFFRPQNIPSGLSDVSLIVTIIERIGQAGCLIVLIISKDSFEDVSYDIAFLMMMLCVIAYYILWIRYVVKGRDYRLLFEPLLFIPIPMAIFPVFAFGIAAIWGRSVLLGTFVLILSVGHFINSWHTYCYIRSRAQVGE